MGESTRSILCRTPRSAPRRAFLGASSRTPPVPSVCSRGLEIAPPFVETSAGRPRQAVHHARCRASLRLDGGEWSKAAEVETGPDGCFRVALPVGFSGIFTPEAEAIPLLQDVQLSVAGEVVNELDGYRREFQGYPGYRGVLGSQRQAGALPSGILCAAMRPARGRFRASSVCPELASPQHGAGAQPAQGFRTATSADQIDGKRDLFVAAQCRA